MADFTPALAKTLVREGGFFHSSKTGEVANRGITHWTLRNLGLVPPLPRNATATDHEVLYLRNMTDEQVAHIYETQYWKPLQCDALNSQALAEKLFDLGVNMGIGQAAKLLQRAYTRLVWPSLLVEDGIVGPKTVAAINSFASPVVLLKQLKAEATSAYKQIAIATSQQDQLNGWLKRLES